MMRIYQVLIELVIRIIGIASLPELRVRRPMIDMLEGTICFSKDMPIGSRYAYAIGLVAQASSNNVEPRK